MWSAYSTSLHGQPFAIPVKDETKERLLLYKNSDLRNTMTYDEALNKILDEMGVPAADEIDDYYRDLSAKISG